MVGGAFAAYAALSIVRHETYRSTCFDLALFEQVVRIRGARGAGERAQGARVDLLRPRVAGPGAAGPLYALWPSAAALLVAQAALVAASAVPVFLYAQPRVGRGPALMLAGRTCCSAACRRASGSNFHELAFAPLLIRCRRRARRPRPLALVVRMRDRAARGQGGHGVRRRRAGPVVRRARAARARGRVGRGRIGWLLLVTEVLVPGYGYWSYTELRAERRRVGRERRVGAWRVVEVAVNHGEKLKTTAYLFGASSGCRCCRRCCSSRCRCSPRSCCRRTRPTGRCRATTRSRSGSCWRWRRLMGWRGLLAGARAWRGLPRPRCSRSRWACRPRSAARARAAVVLRDAGGVRGC